MMTFLLYLLSGLLILGAVLAFLPVEFRIRYGREGEEDLLRLDLFIWPKIRYGFRFVMIDFRSTLINNIFSLRGEVIKGGQKSTFHKRKRFTPSYLLTFIKQLKEFAGIYSTARPAINSMINSVRLNKLTWKTELGTGDPFYTGLAAAMLWSAKGFIITLIYSRLKASGPPLFSINPCFNRRCLNITLDCILKTRTGHIIFTGARIFAALVFSGKLGTIARIMKRPGRRYVYARASH